MLQRVELFPGAVAVLAPMGPPLASCARRCARSSREVLARRLQAVPSTKAAASPLSRFARRDQVSEAPGCGVNRMSQGRALKVAKLFSKSCFTFGYVLFSEKRKLSDETAVRLSA